MGKVKRTFGIMKRERIIIKARDPNARKSCNKKAAVDDVCSAPSKGSIINIGTTARSWNTRIPSAILP